MPVPADRKMIDLDALRAKRVRTVAVRVTDDEDLLIDYKPDLLTKQLQQEIAEVEGEDAAALLMSKLLCGWNLTVNGEAYPITIPNLEALGLPLLLSIATLVQEDFNANVSLGKPTSSAPASDSPTA